MIDVRRRLRLQTCLVVLAAGFLVSAPPIGGQQGSDESRVKAAFVFHFPQWVEWPARALDGRTTMEYCVWPPHPIGAVLRDLVAGEMLAGRTLEVRELTSTASVATCHVLFVPGTSARPILERVGSRPVLTIGDSPRFLDDGGVIQLVRADNRLRFEINVPAADRAGLRLSSHLLRLAGSVRGGQP